MFEEIENPFTKYYRFMMPINQLSVFCKYYFSLTPQPTESPTNQSHLN